MKALVGAFNKERAPSGTFFRHFETSRRFLDTSNHNCLTVITCTLQSPCTRRSVGVTLSAMKSNQRWHSITPHSAVATSARCEAVTARVVQSCHQDIRTRRSLITSLHYTLLAFTFLLLISSMPPEFYRKPISSPPGQLDRVSLPRPQPLKVEHSGIITFIASCHARCSAHKRLCRQTKLPPIA